MNDIMFIFVFIVLSVVVASFGENRKFGFWGYLFASLLFTPLVGLLLVLASDAPEKKSDKKPE